jgi:hypothetical protein
MFGNDPFDAFFISETGLHDLGGVRKALQAGPPRQWDAPLPPDPSKLSSKERRALLQVCGDNGKQFGHREESEV